MKSIRNLLLLSLPLFLGSATSYGQKMDPLEASKSVISFRSNGLLLKGWLFKPLNDPGKGKLPAIVMAPGFSGVKECNYQFFASKFAKEGFAVLLFDYPNFGESEGTERGEIDPWQQIQAYRDGISFLETREDVDINRIGIWGGSYSGGHALVVAALDKRVKCMVAMTPFISGSFYMKNMPVELSSYLVSKFNEDRRLRLSGEGTTKIPVASDDKKQFTAISSPNAWNFIQSFKDYAPNYKNLVTMKSLEMQLEYEPGYYAPNIGGIPKLFIIARNDEVVPEQQIQETYQKVSEPKKLEYIDGHHFSAYMEQLPEASRLAVEWFKMHL